MPYNCYASNFKCILAHRDLSDDMGQGLIEGPIPSTWLMMTKLRAM